jgi:hypothetical protein
MLSNFIDDEGQEKIKIVINNFTLPIKFYAIILLSILLLNSFYLYSISKNLSN